MGASRTKIGRPGRKRFFENRLGALELLPQDPFLNDERVELPAHREQILSPLRFEPHGLDILFQERIQLFDHDDLLHSS